MNWKLRKRKREEKHGRGLAFESLIIPKKRHLTCSQHLWGCQCTRSPLGGTHTGIHTRSAPSCEGQSHTDTHTRVIQSSRDRAEERASLNHDFQWAGLVSEKRGISSHKWLRVSSSQQVRTQRKQSQNDRLILLHFWSSKTWVVPDSQFNKYTVIVILTLFLTGYGRGWCSIA